MSKQESLFAYRQPRKTDEITVLFGAERWAQITQWAEQRNESVEISAHASVDGDKAHKRGLMGEVGMMKHYGIELETPVVAEKMDDGYEFSLKQFADNYDSPTVDVKTSPLDYPVLKHAVHKELTADLYVLALATTGKCRTKLVGWVPREQLKQAPVEKPDEQTGWYQKNRVIRNLKQLRRMPEQWEVVQ